MATGNVVLEVDSKPGPLQAKRCGAQTPDGPYVLDNRLPVFENQTSFRVILNEFLHF